MKSISDYSIKWKLVASIGVAAILIFLVLTGFTIMETSAEVSSLTEQRMDQEAQAQANAFNTDMEQNKKVATSLAATMEAYNREDASREEVSEMLENLAEQNPDALGVYVAYEPDAFDGNDAAHLSGTGPGSNEAGRFAPYWSRFDGNLSLAPLNDLDTQDWYTEPLEQGETIIKGPFVFDDRYMISFLAPITRGGETVGVAGIDVSIDYWQTQIRQVNTTGEGYAFMTSSDGTVVAHPNGSLVGQATLAELGNRNDVAELTTMQERIETQTSGNFTMQDPETGKKVLVRYQSIETGGFVYATVITEDSAMSGVTSLRNGLLAVSGVSLLALIGIIFVGAGRITRPIKRLTAKASAIEDGDYEVELQNSRGDEVGVLYGSLATMRDSLVTNIQEAERAREQAQTAKEEAAKAREEAEMLNTHLQEKAETFSEKMERAADGDLTQRMHPESQSDAMTDIAEAFNEMVADIERTVGQIRSFADDVAESSQEVTTGATESQAASEQVSKSIQQIAADAESQSADLSETTDEMQGLSGTVEEVASSADQIAMTSQETAALGQDGQVAAREAMNEMEDIETQAEGTVTEVDTLAEEIDQISEVIELIGDIAEQTNMLALNASIEAARAGEAGEGFAVVADEIKSLSAEVSEATEEVETLITDIQTSTDTVVDDIQGMSTRVSSGATTIEDALTALDEIAVNIEEVNEGIQEISAATDDQAASTEEVASMVDDVANAAQKVSAESGDASAAAQQQTSALTQVTHNAETLTERADELQTLLSQFRIQTNTTSIGESTGGSQSAVSTDGGPDT